MAPERSGDKVRSRELYPCHAACVDNGRPYTHQRAEWRCALPGFNRRRWHPAPKGGFYMGRLSVIDDPTPRESHDDGCPGSWYRSGFVQSIEPYERPNADGVYSANPLLDRCENPLVLDAIRYLERERARARSYHREHV